MKKYALAIGSSSLEYLNILLTYYPRDLVENFDIFFFFDSKKISEKQLKDLISKHNIEIFKNSNFIDLANLYKIYELKYSLIGKPKEILHEHGALFKILQPLYLIEEFGYEKVLSSDDDIFILRDLSPIFENYKEYCFKKEQLFILRTSNKFNTLNAFNKIFDLNLTLEEANSLTVNSGNILSIKDEMLSNHFYNFITNDYVHYLYFNFEGFTKWTLEQRFHQFNLHYLKSKNKSVELFNADDLRLFLSVDKEPEEMYLKKTVPRIIHYAVGKKKPIFLNYFLKGIEWRYGIKYDPKYELKDKLFVEKPISKLF
jgi:hypothetical protein